MPLTEYEKGKITELFHYGYTYKMIHYLLEASYGIIISFPYLKRKVIPSLGLARRGPMVNSSINAIVIAIMDELQAGPARCSGSQTMLMVLKRKYGLLVSRDMVRRLLQILDPENVRRRRGNRLMRRQYRSKGPDYLWHIDGYDKLSRFGLCIHGCIDGFSRRMMWLKVGVTNHDPLVVASYFMNTIESIGGCPRRVRCDRGTENIKIAAIQTCLTGSVDHVFFGPSTSNQRIEQWWNTLRRRRLDWWIQHFRDLESRGEVEIDNRTQIMCIQFCYMNLIQSELDEVQDWWNHHRIRAQRAGDIVSGVPDILYHNPEIQGEPECHSYRHQVDMDSPEVRLCKEQWCNFDCTLDTDFVNVATEICQIRGLEANPETGEEALTLYREIKLHVEDLLQ